MGGDERAVGEIARHAFGDHSADRRPRDVELQNLFRVYGDLGEKGFFGRDKFYYPVVTKAECIERESKSVLDKIEAGSVKLMVTSMVRAGNLKKEDKEELLSMLEALLSEEAQHESDR